MNNATDSTISENVNALISYADYLESFSKKPDKYSLVYIIPSEAYYGYADIPYAYRICSPNKLRGIDLLRKLIAGRELIFLTLKRL